MILQNKEVRTGQGKIPNSISINGIGSAPIDFVLSKAFEFKNETEPIIVLDYNGRGAITLDLINANNLNRYPVFWYDLADRVNTKRIFGLTESENFKPILKRVISKIVELSRNIISEITIDWAVDVAYNISKNGEVGLGAILRSLSSPEIRRWFLDINGSPKELNTLINTLSWALKFPSVYALSEGVNAVKLSNLLDTPCTIWFEMYKEHFEQVEKIIAGELLEATLADTLVGNAALFEKAKLTDSMLTVLHINPGGDKDNTIKPWVYETSAYIKHIAVHSLFNSLPPLAMSKAWSACAEKMYVVGSNLKLSERAHGSWLNRDELHQIQVNRRGSVFIRDNYADMHRMEVHKHKNRTPCHESYKYKAREGKTSEKDSVTQFSTALSLPHDIKSENSEIFDKLVQYDTLMDGWYRISSTGKGGKGVDGVNIKQFKANLNENINTLSKELIGGSYSPRPLKRALIPKEDGSMRNLGIPCVRDRVVQGAVLILLEPIFEQNFSSASFGFRFRRNCHQAIAMARGFINTGSEWAVTADIKKCFDTIDHDVLMGFLSKKISDNRMLELIKHWLIADIEFGNEFFPSIQGVPQGESISPLLANIYLDPLDKHFEAHGIKFVRYADDILIFADTEKKAKEYLGILSDFLHNVLKLSLKPAKTLYSRVSDGINYLGFTIYSSFMVIKGEKLETIDSKLKQLIAIIGSSNTTIKKQYEAFATLDSLIRGVSNYYGQPEEDSIEVQFRKFDELVEKLGKYYLSNEILEDPVWLRRERFSKLKDINIELEEVKKNIHAAIDGYNRISLAKKKTKKNDSDISCSDGSLQHIDNNYTPVNGIFHNNNRLYVMLHGAYLGLSGDELFVRKNNTEVHKVPLATLDMIYIHGRGSSILVELETRAVERGISIVLASNLGKPVVTMNSVFSSNSHIRGLQISRRDDVDIIKIGLKMLSAKVNNQAAVLKYFAKYKNHSADGRNLKLKEKAVQIEEISNQINALNPSESNIRSVAMGYEGRAASIYWNTLAKIVPTEYSFDGRVKQGATDIINQCLNYAYGILYGEVWRAVTKAGLDPYFGIMHGSERDNGSLIFDVIEEYRAAFVDRLIFGLIGKGFKPAFGENSFLDTVSKKRIAKAFTKQYNKIITWRSKKTKPLKIIESQVQDLAKVYKGEGNYLPYKMKW